MTGQKLTRERSPSGRVKVRPTNVYLTDEQRAYIELRAEVRTERLGIKVTYSDVMREAVECLMAAEPLDEAA